MICQAFFWEFQWVIMLVQIRFSPRSRWGRRGYIFCLAERCRQTKACLCRMIGGFWAFGPWEYFWCVPERWSLCSNRRLPIGAEEKSPSAISASQRWTLGSKATNVSPKTQWNQNSSQEIPLNFDRSDELRSSTFKPLQPSDFLLTNFQGDPWKRSSSGERRSII